MTKIIKSYHYKFTLTPDGIEVNDHGKGKPRLLRSPFLFEDYERLIPRPKYVNKDEWKHLVGIALDCTETKCPIGQTVSLYIDVKTNPGGEPNTALSSIFSYDHDHRLCVKVIDHRIEMGQWVAC